MRSHTGVVKKWLLIVAILLAGAPAAAVAETVLRTFPNGSIYEYRWKLLELALAHSGNGETFRLEPYAENVTQNRGITLLQSGAVDVIALGTTEDREAKLRPIRIDILRGIVGYRLLVIRKADQDRIAALDAGRLRQAMTFGLNSQWADLAILQGNGFAVTTSPSYENLFAMLAGGRFDAFPRGLNEAARELAERQDSYPQLAIEKTKALFFPYPVYFWVNKDNAALAERIDKGLYMALADGSFRRLFESYHAAEIAAVRREKREIIVLNSPILPAGTPQPDTRWWWPPGDDR